MRRALAIDETELRPGSSRCGDPPQQSRASASGHEPPRRGRAADAPRARDRRDRATAAIIPMWRSDLNNLAQLLQATNRLAEAEPLMRRALAIDETSFGPDHPNVAHRPQQSRAAASGHEPARRGRAADAPRAGDRREEPTGRIILMWRSALTISRNCFRPRTASPKPSRLMRRALAIDETELRPGSSRMSRSDLNNLASAASRPRTASPRPNRSCAVRSRSTRRATARIIPMWRSDLNNLAQLLQATNRLAEAEPLMRRALAIFEASLGPDHPNTVTARNNLAALEAALGQGARERGFIHRPHPEEPAQRASRRMIQLALADSCVLDGPSRRAFRRSSGRGPRGSRIRPIAATFSQGEGGLKSGRRWSASGRACKGRGRGA